MAPWHCYKWRLLGLASSPLPSISSSVMAANAKKALIFFFLMASAGGGLATNYKVGDKVGWTNQTSKDFYKNWSSSKTFFVGDAFNFLYNYNDSDVMQVSKQHFAECNNRYPLNIYESGRDNITLDSPGHYFYISEKNDGCKLGQKVDLLIHPARSSTSGSPGPTLHAPWNLV